MSFEAKYRGHCDECDEPIEVGDTLTYLDDVAVHLHCKEVPLRHRRPEEVCTECWLIKPCGCDS